MQKNPGQEKKVARKIDAKRKCWRQVANPEKIQIKIKVIELPYIVPWPSLRRPITFIHPRLKQNERIYIDKQQSEHLQC